MVASLKMNPAESIAEADVVSIARHARKAARVLATLSGPRRNEVLAAAALAIEQRQALVLAANERDIGQMAAQVREVGALDDPLGRTLAVTELDDDLILHKETCPLGVLGVIF